MGRYAHEELTRIMWVPLTAGIVNIASPTDAELAGVGSVYLSPFVKKDGFSTPQNQNNIDSATIAESFDAQTVGSWGGQLEMTCYRDDGTDTAWNLFVYRTRGFIVARRGIAASTAFAAADKVEVYPVQMHQPIPSPSTANEMATFTAMMAVTAQPNLKAVVVAA